MANVVITDNTDTIKFAFNSLSSDEDMTTLYIGKSRYMVHSNGADTLVRVAGASGYVGDFCFTATTGAMLVDSVAGAAPTSNADLLDKIEALMT